MSPEAKREETGKNGSAENSDGAFDPLISLSSAATVVSLDCCTVPVWRKSPGTTSMSLRLHARPLADLAAIVFPNLK